MRRSCQTAHQAYLRPHSLTHYLWQGPMHLIPSWRRLRLASLVLGVTLLFGCPASDSGDPTGPSEPPPNAFSLSIAPSIQQTTVWCWAASAEMVFRHYGLPNLNPGGNYQCGLVAAWYGSVYPQCLNDCSQCQLSMGPMSNEQRLINEYGSFVRSLGISSPVLTSSLIFRALDQAEIAADISRGRPIIVGIAPGGGFALPNASQHVAVIFGYDFSGPVPYVLVNDPFPFQYYPFNQNPHPYLQAGGTAIGTGSYAIPYVALVTSLQWANTIYRIRQR